HQARISPPRNQTMIPKHLLFLLLALFLAATASAAEAPLKDLSVNGGVAPDGKARLVIAGNFGRANAGNLKVIFSTANQHYVRATREKLTHTLIVTLDILQGEPKELALTIGGEGEIKSVTGELLQDWGLRQTADGGRTLVLRPKKGEKPVTQFQVV